MMPNESTAAAPGPGNPAALPPGVAVPGTHLPASERSRLTQCYNRGAMAVDGKPPNLDYAVEMFALCVLGDPGNAIYTQVLLGALRQKFGARKSGGLASLWSGGGRLGLRKLAANAQWREILKQGVGLIKANPADHGSLLAMAEACGNLMFSDAQRVYLKAALDAAPKDVEVNKQCAKFLADQGEFDQAIACWLRISAVKSLAEEAQREIARLQVEKTIVAGHGMAGRAGGRPAAGQAGTGDQPATDRATVLRQQIKENPAGIEAYLELADLLERDATVAEAEQMLAVALSASGGDIKVQEHIEDRHLRWARHRVMLAEKRQEEDGSSENRRLVERLRAEQIKREIDVYGARCQRYPENVIWKYELAMRLKAAGNHTEAIRHFQEVLGDPRRKGAVSLELGECFQKIKQYELSMQNYRTAVEVLSEREPDLRKRALYRAGVLAAGLGDTDSARKYLALLAGLDFGYRDVRERLDKLGMAVDNSGSGQTPDA
jgi:tetratricopeptide (TPR) repeat protein